MVPQVEYQVMKEKSYTNRPKIIYLSKKWTSMSVNRSLLVYDRGQCAESSYLNQCL